VKISDSFKTLQSLVKKAPGWFWTLVSMLVSIGAYSWLFGWVLATGIVLILLFHELGHVLMALVLKIRIGYPIFYPGVGAIIDLHQSTPGPIDNALLGIIGPIFGTIASATCWGIFAVTGVHYWAELAFIGMMFNLFNLLPLGEIDGGRVSAVLSRWLCVPGYILLGVLAWFVRTPIVLLSLVFMLPKVVEVFKKKQHLSTADQRVLPSDRLIIGTAYLFLICFLTFGSWNLWTKSILPGFRDGKSHMFPHHHQMVKKAP
jgi:Zn-dependent protease